MKIITSLLDDPIPLRKKQNISLFLIMILIFEFSFSYTSVLADNNKKIEYHPTVYVRNISVSSYNKSIPQKIEVQEKKIEPAHIVVSVSKHIITAYNSEKGQTDNSPCVTANNFNVCTHGKEDTIAVNFLPFGTKVIIPELFGNRVFVVRDRMNKKHSSRVDVWMKNKEDAVKFGVKYATIQVIK